MMNKFTFPAIAVALFVGTVARAEIVAHNGNSASDPAPSPSELAANLSLFAFGPSVNETLDDSNSFFDPRPFDDVSKTFHEMATLELEYLFLVDEDEPPVADAFETVTNDTGVGWSGFFINIQFADFHVPGEGGLLPVSEGELTVGDVVFASADFLGDPTMTLARGTDPAKDVPSVQLEILFGDRGLLDGEEFTLTFDIGLVLDEFDDPVPLPDGVSFDGFAMQQTPVAIPAPGAAVLAMLGLGCVGWVRRRGA